MELKHLDTFILTAELASFTKAAEKLGYSQSTVSFQMKQLESSLNTQLFERINHTVTLTEKGEEVLRYAHQIRQLTNEMEKQISASQTISGHVRIAMADSLCNWILEDNFKNIRKKYPDITLQIIAASTEEMFRLLNQNEVDMVYTLDNHIYDRTYVIASEEKMEAHFVANLPGLRGRDIFLEDLVNFPFLLTEKKMSYRRLMDEKLASMSLEIQPVLETGNTSLICRLVEQGMGVSFLPDYVTEASIQSGSMFRLHISEFEIHIWKQLLYHRDKWVSPQMQAVIKEL